MIAMGNMKGTTFNSMFGYSLKSMGTNSGKKTLKDVQKNKERVEKILGPVPTPFEISMMGKKKRKK